MARESTQAARAFCSLHGMSIDSVEPTARSGVVSVRACRKSLNESLQRMSEARGDIPARFRREEGRDDASK